MSGGITYAGDYVPNPPSGYDPALKIEIEDSRDDFLEQAADKKPDTYIDVVSDYIGSAASGFYSFPRDWWLAVHWAIGSAGLYGGAMQARCKSLGHKVSAVLAIAAKSPALMYKMTVFFLSNNVGTELANCALHNPAVQDRLEHMSKGVRAKVFTGQNAARVGGRLAGGYFTNYALTGGRFGRRILSGPVKAGGAAGNFVLASYGAALNMVIHNESADPVKLIYAVISGSDGSDLSISNEDWMTAMNALSQCGVVDEEDYRHYLNLVNALMEFNGKYK